MTTNVPLIFHLFVRQSQQLYKLLEMYMIAYWKAITKVQKHQCDYRRILRPIRTVLGKVFYFLNFPCYKYLLLIVLPTCRTRFATIVQNNATLTNGWMIQKSPHSENICKLVQSSRISIIVNHFYLCISSFFISEHINRFKMLYLALPL